MTREKQIEEMANLILRETDLYNVDTAFDIATILHDANYRKATDVAREIIETVESGTEDPITEWHKGYFAALSDVISILKKKYTEVEE